MVRLRRFGKTEEARATKAVQVPGHQGVLRNEGKRCNKLFKNDIPEKCKLERKVLRSVSVQAVHLRGQGVQQTQKDIRTERRHENR